MFSLLVVYESLELTISTSEADCTSTVESPEAAAMTVAHVEPLKEEDSPLGTSSDGYVVFLISNPLHEILSVTIILGAFAYYESLVSTEEAELASSPRLAFIQACNKT